MDFPDPTTMWGPQQLGVFFLRRSPRVSHSFLSLFLGEVEFLPLQWSVDVLSSKSFFR
jgi:hypothetical protein